MLNPSSNGLWTPNTNGGKRLKSVPADRRLYDLGLLVGGLKFIENLHGIHFGAEISHMDHKERGLERAVNAQVRVFAFQTPGYRRRCASGLL